MNRFKDRVCLITGAGSGIGAATAMAFANEEGKVIAADINENASQQIANKINALDLDMKRKSSFI